MENTEKQKESTKIKEDNLPEDIKLFIQGLRLIQKSGISVCTVNCPCDDTVTFTEPILGINIYSQGFPSTEKEIGKIVDYLHEMFKI